MTTYQMLPLLLLFLFLHQQVGRCTIDLHPVVLLPGYFCSQIEVRLNNAYMPPTPHCGANKGKGWFRLWENKTALQDLTNIPCFVDMLRLVYDPIIDDYRNVQGVDTRVMSFDSTRGLSRLCMARLVEELEGVGYRDGESLFAALYDFRYAPAASGHPSGEFSRYSRRLRALVERASSKNHGKPVILVTHSFGGFLAVHFLNRSPLSWRRRFVKHFVMIGTGADGIVLVMQDIASGPSSPADVFGQVKRTFASLFFGLPTPKVFGNTPLVITRAKNYTAYDTPEFLTAVGLPAGAVRLYKTRVLPVALNFRAPVVPMTCINGIGTPTVKKLVYWDGDFDVSPAVVYGDGDGVINLESILALDTVVGKDPRQGYFESIRIANMTHTGLISDKLALKRVISEVVESKLHHARAHA